MDTQAVVQDIVAAFEDLSDPRRVEKSKTYFPTSMKVMGVTNPNLKVVIKELKGSYPEWNQREWIDLCKRRRAVVSTVALNLKSRGGTGDIPRTIRVCERVVDERQDMIQKALSWALRELSKRDRAAVVDFMELHEPRLARRVVKEVTHKLDFGTKN